MLFLKRSLHTKFDLLKPDLSRKVREKQADQKSNHDVQARERSLPVNSEILARDFIHKEWLPGTIIGVLGPCSYLVELKDGCRWKRHIDQLKLLASHFRGDFEVLPSSLTVPADKVSLPSRYPSRTRRPVDRYGINNQCITIVAV